MNRIIYTVLIAPIFFLFGCSKTWLEEKQDIKLIVPTSLNDLGLLMNGDAFQYDGRGAIETSCDDYQYTVEQFQVFSDIDRDLISWKKDKIFENSTILSQNEWNMAYRQIQICNVVLAVLEKINSTESNRIQYNTIKGAALYHRAKQFLNLAMTFCESYNKTTAKGKLGIPIKLTDDIDEFIVRANLEDTYGRIVTDLKLASKLLPISKITVNTVSKAAAFALLARAELFMGDYEIARDMADSSYKYCWFVEDYNKIVVSSNRPLNKQSEEAHILPMSMVKVSQSPTRGRIADDLYEMYDENDMRKILFFKKESDNKYTFRGHYTSALFTGTTTAEVLLILAECHARLGNIQRAMTSLNLLLKNRYKSGFGFEQDPIDVHDAIRIVLDERRKELVSRGLRWQDLKRLNQQREFEKQLVRTIGGVYYDLPPNDLRYVLPIPQDIIGFNSIQQNPY